jgi:hypothetical protein
VNTSLDWMATLPNDESPLFGSVLYPSTFFCVRKTVQMRPWSFEARVFLRYGFKRVSYLVETDPVMIGKFPSQHNQVLRPSGNMGSSVSLYKASEKGDVEKVRALLTTGTVDVNIRGEYGVRVSQRFNGLMFVLFCFCF